MAGRLHGSWTTIILRRPIASVLLLRRIWAYWISPFAYLLRGIVINEMTSAHWDAPYSPGVTLGVVWPAT